MRLSKNRRVFLGLGSNVGNRMAALRGAVRGLETLPKTSVIRLSCVYETKAVGPRQRKFLNAVAEIQTQLSPRTLLKDLQDLEIRLGRKKRRRWGPREIDLDILFYEDRVIRQRDLMIPHPELENRRFVLDPMGDLAPSLTHPLLGKKLDHLRRELAGPGQRTRLIKKPLWQHQKPQAKRKR